MNKIFHLSTCSTCQRILKEVGTNGFTLQDLKVCNINAKELDLIFKGTGSYEALFNKRAVKFKSPEVRSRIQKDSDYRQLILEEYTFLKRPVFVIGEQVFSGNDKKTLAQVKDAIHAK